MTEMLNIYQALELYDLLKPYLPEEIDERQEAVDFVLDLIGGMKTEEGAEAYFEALDLMDSELPENAAAPDYVNAFIEGLTGNSVVSLSDFSSKLGL